ncbi:MAG: HEAT repeat domain-containing protein, partial [Pirellulales bacterium]|nr:HEAT repeat domain-containing protein [Pirellulales bacterium]
KTLAVTEHIADGHAKKTGTDSVRSKLPGYHGKGLYSGQGLLIYANNGKYTARLQELRRSLYDWMLTSRDPGLIPEPILEDLGKRYGSKPAALGLPAMQKLFPRLLAIIEAGEQKDLAAVRHGLSAVDPSERYWAATWAGVNRDKEATDALKVLSTDTTPTVRVAACLSLCQLGQAGTYLPKLVELVKDPNLIVGMYAMNAIEQSKIRNDIAAQAAVTAKKSPYEFTRRYGKRLEKLVK